MNRTLRTISLAVVTAILLTPVLAQGQPQQKAAPKTPSQTSTAAKDRGTPGRIAKFTGTRTIGDSNITEDRSGNIGIGTTQPTSRLTVNGVVEMTSAQGSIKFPDGTTQTTAGLATVSRDTTFKGDGTQSSPLGLAVPLKLDQGPLFGSTLEVSNANKASHAITATSGFDAGVAVRGIGRDSGIPGNGMIGIGGFSATLIGGFGVSGRGGNADSGPGGVGVSGGGGASNTGNAGDGVTANGGRAFVNGNGGRGMRAVGGIGRGTGKSGGHAIETFPGTGENGASNGLAGKFNGDVQVTGTLSKGGGSFRIDHPTDPENKFLSHSFVESPDMMNIYNGNITTDQNGLATVELPDYFDSLNRDFRYQLTVVGRFAQAIVADEVNDNRFTIQTNVPGVKVSWQVTGVRQDAWANKNRIPVEETKSGKERGHYLHPEAFSQPEERGILWANQPDDMRKIKEGALEVEQSGHKCNLGPGDCPEAGTSL